MFYILAVRMMRLISLGYVTHVLGQPTMIDMMRVAMSNWLVVAAIVIALVIYRGKPPTKINVRRGIVVSQPEEGNHLETDIDRRSLIVHMYYLRGSFHDVDFAPLDFVKTLLVDDFLILVDLVIFVAVFVFYILVNYLTVNIGGNNFCLGLCSQGNTYAQQKC